jgi:hypothetical protein
LKRQRFVAGKIQALGPNVGFSANVPRGPEESADLGSVEIEAGRTSALNLRSAKKFSQR